MLAALGISAVLIASPVNANGCYSSGETFSQVATHDDIFSAMNDACNGFAGTFLPGQQKTSCSAFPGGDRVDWGVTNIEGSSQALDASDCISAMTIEINACSQGSQQDHGSFNYKDDPNSGSC